MNIDILPLHKASGGAVNDIGLCVDVQERLGGDSEPDGEGPGAEAEERVVIVDKQIKEEIVANEKFAPLVANTFVKIVEDERISQLKK